VRVPPDPNHPDRDAPFHRRFIRDVDAHNATADINGPDEWGAFPGSTLDALLPEVSIVVPDTNVFRLDLDHSCGAQKRGVLISAANTGSIRLLCAEHVINEVERKLQEWADYQQQHCQAAPLERRI
jgi:hypothetical protein